MGILRQKAITGMNSLSLAILSGSNDIGYIKIALPGRGSTDTDSLIRLFNMQAVFIRY